jgi:hypothetical protein
MMNNKPIIPRTVCMQFAQLGSVSRDCHSKLHHLCDVKCSKNALQFYLRWLVSISAHHKHYPRQDPADTHYYPGQIIGQQSASISKLQSKKTWKSSFSRVLTYLHFFRYYILLLF